ncbi:cell division protein SepF [Aquibacillus rhizosphaerae]|uniref:Cell division protein SepF n=1 Tax=Aquibacillus rhizosphaerae TaxID=3051431 RepID=A0ABT7L2A4_9BACI|nr:cell division protein SepF [Aquibacillus sp. LR5S19]MDL4839985.1 cell division protein SepF [Aquibacillus sp. LR5S19]
MSLKNKIKTFFTDEDEYEYVEEEQSFPVAETRQERRQNVVSLKSVQAASKVVLCEPRAFSEAQEIADHIVNRRAVVINLQRVQHTEAKQIVDFLSGTVYAVSGEIQKLGSQTFLCTPDNVDVSGSISDILEEEDLEKGW